MDETFLKESAVALGVLFHCAKRDIARLKVGTYQAMSLCFRGSQKKCALLCDLSYGTIVRPAASSHREGVKKHGQHRLAWDIDFYLITIRGSYNSQAYPNKAGGTGVHEAYRVCTRLLLDQFYSFFATEYFRQCSRYCPS